MQPIVEIAHLLDPVLSIAKGQLCLRRIEVKFPSTLKRQPALADVPLILRRVERDLHIVSLSTLS